MTQRKKWVVWGCAGLILTYLIPLMVMACLARGTGGYFAAGKCMGGHESFTYIRENGYYSFSPGHGENKRTHTLRLTNGVWEGLKDNGNVAFRLRLYDGDLYWQGKVNTNWFKMERVYNPWRFLAAKVLAARE